MDEKTVKQVIKRYLSERGLKFSISKEKEAGPDILIDGVALETKGDSFDIKSALKQFTKYAFKYANLEVAFPTDVVTIELLYALYVIESAIKYRTPLKPRAMKIYLVCKSNQSRYSIRIFESIEAVIDYIKESISQASNLPLVSDETRMKNAIENSYNINKLIKKLLKKEISSFGHKVVLENE